MAQTCEAALARLAEAEAGSPLISEAEMEEVRTLAFVQAGDMCGPDYDLQMDREKTAEPGAEGE